MGPIALLEYIDHLPGHSRLNAAIADDPEAAQELAKHDLKPSPPPLTEYSPEVRALAVIVDRLAGVQQAIIASAGKRPPKVDEYPRPVTELDRARERDRQRKHHGLVAFVEERRRHLARLRQQRKS